MTSRWLRRLQRRLGGGRGIVRERIHGVSLEYDGATFIGATLFTEGGFEEAEIAFCAARLQALDAPVLLDLGANLGWHTLRWATQLPSATIHAFEPAPEPRARLQRNVASNGLDQRVHVHGVAVSSAAGSATFHLTADDAYGSLLTTERSPVTGRVEVPVVTLDEFVEREGLRRVDFIKIDVEGVEHEVLQGAAGVVSSLRPDLLVEIYQGERVSPTAADIVEGLGRFGYRAYVFQEGRLVPFATHRDWYYNYFFTAGAEPA